MLTGFVHCANGSREKIASLEELHEALKQDPRQLWVDLEGSEAEEVQHVGQLLGLSGEAIEDCLEGEQRPRIDDYNEYFLLVLYGVVPPEGEPGDGPRKLVVICGSNFLVTVHPEPLKTTNTLRRQCERRGGACITQGVDRLTFRIVDGIVDNYLALIEQWDDEIEDIEERSFEHADENNLLQDVAHMRRQLLELRRLATAQRSLVGPIVRGEFEFVSADLGEQFLHVSDHLTHALDRTEALRDRLSGALLNYHSTLAKRTNDIMRVLTLFAAVMLPLSLIAGIYGMNVPIWPAGNSPVSFWGILASMTAIAGALLWYFRRQGWL